MKRLFVIGDSTVCLFNDSTYFYPRYGYGTQLEKYLNDFEVINLALSGRSSKSFKLEENYQILINSLQEGDYLLIGFGHNDEKYDDPIRFSSASLDIENSKFVCKRDIEEKNILAEWMVVNWMERTVNDITQMNLLLNDND